MPVPVVTLVGRKYGERCGYSILTNLGVTQTIAEAAANMSPSRCAWRPTRRSRLKSKTRPRRPPARPLDRHARAHPAPGTGVPGGPGATLSGGARRHARWLKRQRGPSARHEARDGSRPVTWPSRGPRPKRSSPVPRATVSAGWRTWCWRRTARRAVTSHGADPCAQRRGLRAARSPRALRACGTAGKGGRGRGGDREPAPPVELQPAFAPAQRHLGIRPGERGDSEGALAAFEAAVAIDPKHARTWNNLGNAQRALGRPRMPSTRSSARCRCARTIGWLQPTSAR